MPNYCLNGCSWTNIALLLSGSSASVNALAQLLVSLAANTDRLTEGRIFLSGSGCIHGSLMTRYKSHQCFCLSPSQISVMEVYQSKHKSPLPPHTEPNTTWCFTCLQEEGEAVISANLHLLYLHPCKEWGKDTKELISGL